MTKAIVLSAIIISVILVSGTMGYSISNPTASAANNKVTICHIPPGNPDNAHEIVISEKAVPAHLAHGDKLGPCDTPPPACDPVQCSDNNACTVDQCLGEPATCDSNTFEPERTPCELDDGNVCTSSTGSCDGAGVCVVTDRVCLSDFIFCTTESCDPETGCNSIPDDSKCLAIGSCQVGKCDPNAAPGTSGCFTEDLPNDTTCEDRGGNTGVCTEGRCIIPREPVCGNNICELGEDIRNCPIDCRL